MKLRNSFKRLLPWDILLKTFRLELLFFGFIVFIFLSLIIEKVLLLIGSEFIDPEIYPQMCLQILCGMYQNKNVYLLPPKACGSLWQGFRLGVSPCSYQFIDLLALKDTSSSLYKTYFVDCWIVFIIFNISMFIDPETGPRVTLKIIYGLYSNWSYRFASLQVYVSS